MRLNKHNKKKNTQFLYEVLVRELTKSVLREDVQRKNRVLDLIKKYFSKGKILSRELELYKILSETKDMTKDSARSLLREVLRVYNNFNQNQVQHEQVKIIDDINKDLGKETFEVFVPNYRNLATIYQLFNRKLNPKERVLLEEKMIGHLTEGNVCEKEKETKQIDSFELKTFIEYFNKSYSKDLLLEQKELLSKYVMCNDGNNVEFRVFLNEEVGRVKEIIERSVAEEEIIKSDPEMLQKTKEVLSLVEGFKTKQQIDSDMIEALLKVQGLVREIEEN